ncbi:sensor histidine kinase [Microbacterium sp. gxy059]|uniref:sensor histidine kinase n=1 Tax=Microbacterium sp. gxy059 TaxID=2957199 RepID=UPI003D9A090B
MSDAPRPASTGAPRAGDLVCAGIVLLGGGLLGGALLPGVELLAPSGGPPILGPAPGPAEPHGPSTGGQIATIVLLVGPAALMLVRRRWPIPVFALALAAFVGSVLAGLPSFGPGIAATIAAYAFAFRVPRRPVLIVMSAAAALVVVLAFAATGGESIDARVFQIGAAIAIAAALGDSARSRHEYLLQAEDRAERAERTREAEARRRVSEERLRIARDLHDTVAHRISVINLHAGAASGALPAHPERAQRALGTIREAARGALSEIGDLLRYLRDDDGSEAPPPQQGLEAAGALVERLRGAGLDVETEIRGDLARVTGAAGAVAYRVIQEGLTNAHKHGTGASARLLVDVGPSRLRIEIDNPVAGSGAETTAGTGLGLIGLRERVAVLQGSVETAREGGRHALRVEIPLASREGERA